MGKHISSIHNLCRYLYREARCHHLFEEDTPAELLAYLRPNILVKGGDYKKEDIVGRESVDEVEVLSFKEGYSTSDIVKRIATMAKEGKL